MLIVKPHHWLTEEGDILWIHEWQDTLWASGPCEPVMVTLVDRQGGDA